MRRDVDGEILDWLLSSELPWVEKIVHRDVFGSLPGDSELNSVDKRLFAHPLVKGEIAYCAQWPGPALKRHNTAGHPLNRLGFLVDAGLGPGVRGGKGLAKKLLTHRDRQCGAFESIIELPTVWGGSGKPEWCWMLCDAPVLAHALCAFLGDGEGRVNEALEHLASLGGECGWRCHSSLPKVRGPGRKNDPCPIANLLALKALARSKKHCNSATCKRGTEMLLTHWEQRGQKKYRMFGIGTEFQKLRYPFIWFDILHVVDVLTRFSWTHGDRRLLEMVDIIRSKADTDGRYRAESVWMPYKQFDFGQKRTVSPMLTAMVLRVERRLAVPRSRKRGTASASRSR
jgi:hypothetical protein